jgi:LacI family transcriptional regulator
MSFAMTPPHRIEYCVQPKGAHKAVDVLPTVDAEVLRSLVQGVVGIDANHAGRLNELARAGLPVVAMDFHDLDASFDSVYADHEDAGFQATAHLLAMGHRRIVLVGERCNPRSTDPTWQQRMSGYLRAMAWAGGETPRPLILAGPRDTSKLHRDLPDFHRRHRPTAYVLVGGSWAPELLEILKSIGVECPRDYSLTCCDASCVRVGAISSGTSISYARADYEQAGRIAVQLIASRIACRAIPPARVTIPITFIPGDSSRAIAAEEVAEG